MSEETKELAGEQEKELPKLSRGSWRKKPKAIPASTELLGSFFVLRLSAGRVDEIEKTFPTNKDGSCADYRGFQRALVAEAAADIDGKQIFTASELKDELNPGEFWQLWQAVTEKLDMRASVKN